MHPSLLTFFQRYPITEAPFMHAMLQDWSRTRPLEGLKVLHHVPVVTNTLLKIACLHAAGADVTVTNPDSFVLAQAEAVDALNQAGIRYVTDLTTLKNEPFDIFFDCGGQLYQALGAPKMGVIELTGSGDEYYRSLSSLPIAVISIDRTLTKQLETVFGCAKGVGLAMTKLGIHDYARKSWMVFGFGKMGRGISYLCDSNQIPITVVDRDPNQCLQAEMLGLSAIDANDLNQLARLSAVSDIVITATGVKHALLQYPRTWFKDKILANVGVYDEYGPLFAASDVLNNKLPINFVLADPTPMPYIDPEFYIHNVVALQLMQKSLSPGVHAPPNVVDEGIIERWCSLHGSSREIMDKWFIKY
ncbi:adenosylhomocysteinase [Legionella sp. W05-934-2]|uniref:adenosylhomocysteinase n=1 Tax=Legionella sp. W05-934-2 TaxID=1198649 RepID=UPI003461C1FD